MAFEPVRLNGNEAATVLGAGRLGADEGCAAGVPLRSSGALSNKMLQVFDDTRPAWKRSLRKAEPGLMLRILPSVLYLPPILSPTIANSVSLDTRTLQLDNLG